MNIFFCEKTLITNYFLHYIFIKGDLLLIILIVQKTQKRKDLSMKIKNTLLELVAVMIIVTVFFGCENTSKNESLTLDPRNEALNTYEQALIGKWSSSNFTLTFSQDGIFVEDWDFAADRGYFYATETNLSLSYLQGKWPNGGWEPSTSYQTVVYNYTLSGITLNWNGTSFTKE